MANTEKKQNVLNGAMVLVVATALVKIIGAIYKIPLTDIIGTLGRGYFSSAYNIYTTVYGISMAGLPVAVSALVSRNAALGKYRDVRQVLTTTFPLFAVIGVVGTAALMILAKPYAASVKAPFAVYSIIAIAPSIFFCCIMSTFRGYYEGLSNMYPTAISQVIESAGKLIFGLSLSYIALKYTTSQYEKNGSVFGVSDSAMIPAVAAAAAITGVTVGTVIGALYTFLRHRLKKDGITRTMLVNSAHPVTVKQTVTDLLRIAIPAAISSLVLNITNFIDSWMIQNRLSAVVANHFGEISSIYGEYINAAGIARENIHTFLYGAYDTTLDLKNLIPTIVMTLGVSAIPVVSSAMAKKDKPLVHSTVNTVFRVSALIAFPAGAGFLALAEPILSLLYNGGENQYGIPIAAPVLALYGVMMIILTLSSPLTNIMQAIGRADVPAKALAVGCVFKIGVNYILIGIPSINIKGAVFGTALFYLICIVYNYIVLKKETGLHLDIGSIFVKPLICAALCGAAAFLSNKLLCSVLTFGDMTGRLNGHSLACLISIGVAGVVYLAAVLLSKTIKKDDVLMLPKGEKIAEILAKYKLLG